jgi:ABC-type nitrate/sulfonate/bicarbonate transport system substrate-binding protein
VLIKASAYANAHTAETAPILAKYTGFDPAVIARMPRSHYLATLDVQDIQPLIDASVKYGIVPAVFPARDLLL